MAVLKTIDIGTSQPVGIFKSKLVKQLRIPRGNLIAAVLGASSSYPIWSMRLTHNAPLF